MILVESSVLIRFLRTKDPKLDLLLGSPEMAVCGAIRSEILAGARSAKDRQRLVAFLAKFQHIATPEPVWDLVGDNLSALYIRGISVPFPDVVIATLGIENDCEVWSRDPHFSVMQSILPRLKLFQEPP